MLTFIAVIIAALLVAAAGYLADKGVAGWGWVLVLAIIVGGAGLWGL